jgi:hypothetical protein
MVESNLTVRKRNLAIASLLGLLLSACSQTSAWLKGRDVATSNDATILGAPNVGVYVKELAMLASNDAAAHAEIYADAAAAAQLTPGPSTALRLGLVLSVPGHSESNPERAQSLLRDAITETQLLTPAEISLAAILLNNVERLVVANAEARRLRTSSSRAQRTQDQAVAERLALVETENRRLRRELQDAERKLDAITSIERSMRDQE